jgi:transposase
VPPRQSKVELYGSIQRDSRAGMSVRQLERKYGLGYRTVRAALTSAWPAERKRYPTRASKLDPFKRAIDEMSRIDLDARRKQRHTIRRIYAQLIEEHGMVNVSIQNCARVREKPAPEQPPEPEPIKVNRIPKQERGGSG